VNFAQRKDGMTLMELLVGVVIALALLAVIGIRTRNIMNRAKVSSAEATVSTIALALGSMRDDTGRYPAELADLKGSYVPSHLNIPARFWNGPYLHPRISLIDPWGNPYFYELFLVEEDAETVFGPYVFERISGPPYDETFYFDAQEGTGRVVIVNEDPAVTAGWIWVNGVLVVSPDEFKKFHSEVLRDIELLAGDNAIRIRLASGPGWEIDLRVDFIGNGYGSLHTATYTLGSYGRDGKPGGEGFDAEIVYGEIR